MLAQIIKDKTLRILVIFLLAWTVTGRAQEAWTLEQCIAYAWDNNLSIKQQSLEVHRSENQLLQNKLAFVPSLSASLGHNLNWGRSVDLQNLEIIHNKLSHSTSASAHASIYLLDGLSKMYNLQSSRKSIEISSQEVERLKDEISISIAKSYLQILLSQEILRTAQESMKSITDQRDRTKLLVDAGTQPYSAQLEIESQLASERVQLVTAEGQVRTDLLTLQQLLDLPFDSEFTIVSPDIDDLISVQTISESIDELYEGAQNLPVIRSAVLALARGDIDVKAAKGQYYPKISLSASYGTFFSSSSYAPDGSTYPFLDQFRDNINPSISIGLTIPIFSNWSLKTNTKNAILAREGLELDLRSRQQTLYKEIQTAVNEANTYFRQMEASKSNMEAMEESFRYVEEKFNAGTLNGTDYTVARVNLFQAKSEYLRAKYQYVFQTKIIDFYKGLPLTL